MHLALLILLGLSLPPEAPSTVPTGPLNPAPAVADTAISDAELVQRAQSARVLGATGEDAAITIYEFFDYSCSTCQNFHTQRGDSLKALVGPDVGLRFHSYIIARLPRGYAAAEAAACAAGLGGSDAFFTLHDRLLREPGAWRNAPGPAPFVAWAVTAGLSPGAFQDCLDRDVPAQLIIADGQLGASLGVGGTPTFVVMPRGAQSIEDAVVFYGNEPMSRFREAIAEVRSRVR